MNRNRTSEYIAWENMKSRCTNPHNKRYKHYAGRGITLCERWMKFEGFIADMGTKPSKNHTLDRIDNNGNYQPGNCRWATYSEQNRNHRRNIWIEYNGRRMVRKDWANELHTTDINIIKWMRKGQRFEEIYRRLNPPQEFIDSLKKE